MKKLALVLCNDMHMDLENANLLLTRVQQSKWYEVVCDYTIADIVVVFTCAFGPSKMDSVRVIADVRRNCKPEAKVFVTGCLAKLCTSELKAIPGISVQDFSYLLNSFEFVPTETLSIPYQNKVIISEGCLHHCSYCVYPMIANGYKSKPIEMILQEIQTLYDTESTIYLTGAQETADYGIDLYGKRSFGDLLQRITQQFPDCYYVIGWFHPAGLTEEVISVIAEHPNIIEIMLHIQHVDDEILKNMNRPSFQEMQDKIGTLQRVRPDLKISTEAIVGFPGETEEKFDSLVEYLRKGIFSNIGVASFEMVKGTKAAMMPNQVPEEVKERRMREIEKCFGATCYPASKDGSESLLEEYARTSSILSKMPKNILVDRQKYHLIAGVDTKEKLEGFSLVLEDVLDSIRNARTEFDWARSQKHLCETYTLEARTFFYDLIQHGDFKIAFKERARQLLGVPQ